ncbi:hypothetical protein Acr_28g0000120 [Actinidia rufa]|uniref:Uncharacterized protein n=1 Tax=Actinidia rufa TaxID=165716 RepID=A0A7J0H869_9ERIC|nr:hypothetical protein Acr_28g0000120 [Actinidia rufa]
MLHLQYKRDHEIPHDVLIERPGPNKSAAIMQHGVAELGALHKFVNRNWEFLDEDDGMWAIPRQNGRISDGSNNEYRARTTECKAEISHINNSREPHNVATLLQYELLGRRGSPKVLVVPLIPKLFGEEVEHSFVGEGEEVDSSSEVKIPPKLLKVQEKSGQEQPRAPLPAAVAEVDSSRPTLRPQKDTNKGRHGRAPDRGLVDGVQPKVMHNVQVGMATGRVRPPPPPIKKILHHSCPNPAFHRSVSNFQRKKKRSDELKKVQKRATLEGKLKKKREQLTTTAEELAAANTKLSKK